MPLRFKTSSLDVEVKASKIGNRLVSPQPEIVQKTADDTLVEKVRTVAESVPVWNGVDLNAETRYIHPDTGEEVSASEVLEILEHYKYLYLAEDGRVVDSDEVYDYAVQEDGSELAVEPFSRTKELVVPDENWVPSTAMDDFLIGKVYEVYSTDKKVQRALFEEAEKRLKEDVVGLSTYSFGRGYKQYYAFMVPIVREGRFVWEMHLSDVQMENQHLMDVPAKVKVPVRERVKLQTLPPVQALIAAKKQ